MEKQKNNNTKQMMIKLLSLALIIGRVAAGADTAASDYEAKIQAALENYASQSEDILQRAVQKGNGVGSIEIDADGNVLSSSSASSIYADFGLKAVDEHLSKIEKLNKQKVDAYDTYQEAFSQLAAANDDSEDNPTTITYTQLQEWDEVADIATELEDGEFLTLWQKATGFESPNDGHIRKLSQFVIFNNLLDKLLMAKIDFLRLTKGTGKDEIPRNRLYNWPVLSEEMSDKEFDRIWNEAVGQGKKVMWMNYEQFLVFYELAEEWMERDISEMIQEGLDDEYVGEEEDGYGLPDKRREKFWIEDEELPEDLKADLESDNEDIRNEARKRRELNPERWTEFSYWELHAYFACDKTFASPRPIWTDEQWRDLRDFYHEFVEEDRKDGMIRDGAVRAYQLSKDEYDLTKNAIPFQSGEKGRGLKAVRDIKAGELVFKATNNTIVFNYGHTWRKLLFAINERFNDPGITCDILVWSWVQDLVDGGSLKVVMDMDSGSLLNEGRDVAGWEPPNVQCGKPDATRCDMDYFAFRDIKEGDELLIDYNEFAFLNSWRDMGL